MSTSGNTSPSSSLREVRGPAVAGAAACSGTSPSCPGPEPAASPGRGDAPLPGGPSSRILLMMLLRFLLPSMSVSFSLQANPMTNQDAPILAYTGRTGHQPARPPLSSFSRRRASCAAPASRLHPNRAAYARPAEGAGRSSVVKARPVTAVISGGKTGLRYAMASFEKISSLPPIPSESPRVRPLPQRKPREDRKDSRAHKQPRADDQNPGDGEQIHIDEYA